MQGLVEMTCKSSKTSLLAIPIHRQCIGILFIFFGLGMGVSAQDTLIVPIDKDKHEMSFSIRENGWILTSAISPSGEEALLGRSAIKQYSLYIPQFFYLKRLGSVLFQDTIEAAVFHQLEASGLFFAIDLNRNHDFQDEEVIPIKEDVPFYYELTVPIKTEFRKDKSYNIPLKLLYSSATGAISITSLMKYDINYSLPDTFLKVELNVGVYYPNFIFKTQEIGKEIFENKNYLLGEPFLFMGQYWVFQNLDILNETIELIRFKKGAEPKGYKQGYFVDLNRLFLGHLIPKEVINRSDSSLFILYFWGSWCQPCVQNMPATNQIGAWAKGKDGIHMYGVAFMRSNQNKTDVRAFERKHDLSFFNFTESPKQSFHPMINKLRVNNYPTYLLIDGRGEILHRGATAKDLWEALDNYGKVE
jgi:thiol-disulfide isomerase/thioredoxin